MAVDLVIDIENAPGALAEIAAAISDAGVNIAAATCIGSGERAELHILVPRAEAAKHVLAISGVLVTGEREVVVVDVHDRPTKVHPPTRVKKPITWMHFLTRAHGGSGPGGPGIANHRTPPGA